MPTHTHTRACARACVCGVGRIVLVLKGSESSTRNLHVSRSKTCSSRSDRNLREMSVLLYYKFISRRQATELHHE